MVGDHPWQLSPGQMFKLEWGHRTTFKHVLEAEEGHFQTNPSGGRVGSGRVGRVGSAGSGRPGWVGSDQK